MPIRFGRWGDLDDVSNHNRGLYRSIHYSSACRLAQRSISLYQNFNERGQLFMHGNLMNGIEKERDIFRIVPLK